MINLADIAPTFWFVLGKGLEPGQSDYKPHEFGNAVFEMVGKPFSLRFERDRGQVFVDVGSTVSGWYKLEYVLEFLDKAVSEQQLGAPPNPAVMAGLLQLNWEKVVGLFDDQDRTLQLEIFTKQKSEVLLSKFFRKMP